MSFSLSPSVEINEKNVSFNVANLPSSKTGMVLHCDTGPAFQITPITNVTELEDTFGNPTNYNFRDWFNAWNFLQYANSLYITRPIDAAAITQNVGLGLTGGYGGGIVTSTAAYQVASCGAAVTGDASSVSTTTYYFTVNSVEYNVSLTAADTYTTITTALDLAVDGAGITVTYVAPTIPATLQTGGLKFTHDTVGAAYAVKVSAGTTSPDLFAALGDFDQFDPLVVGTGMTTVPSSAYAIASMGTAVTGDDSGLGGTTAYNFVINDIQYTITTVAALTNGDIVTLIDTAITSAGLTCTWDATTPGVKITNDAIGTAYSVYLDHPATGTDLWSTFTTYDGFDVPVAGVGPGQAMTTHSKLDLGGLYNGDIAEITLDARTAGARLEIYYKWVTADPSRYGVAICSDENSWRQPCAIDTDANGVALFNDFKDYFEFAPLWDSSQFAYIVFYKEDDGTFTAKADGKGIVSYLSSGKDIYGKNIFVEDVLYNSNPYLYAKVGAAASYDNVNTGGEALPMFAQPNPSVTDVTVVAGDSATYMDGDRVIFTNDPDDTTGIGAEGVLTVGGDALASVALRDIGYGSGGYGYTKVPIVSVDSGTGVIGTGTLTAVMTNLPGGTDPTCIYPVDGIATIQSFSGFASDYTVGDVETAFDLFGDPDNFDINILLSHERSLFKASNIATTRKDCVAIVGVTESSDVVGQTSTAATTNVQNTFGWDGVTPSPLPVYNTYCAHYGNIKYLYDKYSDTNRWVPVVGDVAGLMAETDTYYDPWWAVAGLNRGVMRNVIKLGFNPNKANKDVLYFNSINPVVTIPGEGAGIILGQKTSTSVASAMDRLNVRRLLISIEKAIATALRPFMFEFNDEGTRANILGILNPYMDQIKARRGVYDFLVKCDETNNNTTVIDQNALVVNIYVKPTKVAEFLQVNMIVTKTGANFEEVVA